MGGTYYTDIQRSLYDQGVPDRSRWVQEAGNKVLAQISEKKEMSLQDQTNVITQNSNFVSWALSVLQKPLDPL